MNTKPPVDRGYVIRVVKKVLQSFRNQGHPFIGFIGFQRALVVAAFNLPDSGSSRVDDDISGMYDSNHPARHFGLLFADVFQELCLNRYIVIPETGSSRQKVLFVTDRGWSWVDSGEPFPEYAEGYLATIRSSVSSVDPVIEQYLKEALATYDQRSFFSSSVMLGAASERLAYLLLDAIKDWVAVAEPDSVRRIDNVLHRDRSLVKLLEEINRYLRKAKTFNPSPPDEAAGIHLLSIQDSIRRQRNDAVHPIVGEVNADALRLALQAFPGVYRQAYALMRWFDEKHTTPKTLP